MVFSFLSRMFGCSKQPDDSTRSIDNDKPVDLSKVELTDQEQVFRAMTDKETPLNQSVSMEYGELSTLVHVIAPASLPAGYTFEAEVNGIPEKMITVTVVRVD